MQQQQKSYHIAVSAKSLVLPFSHLRDMARAVFEYSQCISKIQMPDISMTSKGAFAFYGGIKGLLDHSKAGSGNTAQ